MATSVYCGCSCCIKLLQDAISKLHWSRMGRSYHREFLHDLVLTLYENHHKGDEEDREGISF